MWTHQNTTCNGNSQADNNLGYPKLRQEDTKTKHTGKPLTMAKTQRHREQHPEQQNCDEPQQHQRRPKPNFNHDTHREDAKTRDHQDKTYPEDHTHERSIRRCETRKKKS